MVTDALRSLWAEPRPANAPPRGWRDWALVAGLTGWSVAEVLLRHDLASGPLLLFSALAVIAPQLWRRNHPLAAVAVCFGTLAAVDVVRVLTGSAGELLNSSLATLVLAYALVRWGSGREAASGFGLILLWLPLATAVDGTGLAERVAGYAVFLCAAALGAAVRYRARVRGRDLEHARTREREQLARELHDTVAHHVSGIAIQAQAGRAVAATHPERAAEVLAVIEEAATSTLTELRAIVGVLRDPHDPELAPQPGLAEVGRLATDHLAVPRVTVTLDGRLDDLTPALGAAVYRLAQESVTNARRHARHATCVAVTVSGDPDQVLVTVEDDGSAGGGRRGPAGFGLVGMHERAALLGGTLRAGPIGDRGWRVAAVLPRTGTAR